MNWSKELLDLAQKAIEHQDAEKTKLDMMSPEDRDIYIREWAKRMAGKVVEKKKEDGRVHEGKPGPECENPLPDGVSEGPGQR